MASKRHDGRLAGALRKVSIECGVLKFADASCLIKWGDTHLICSATLEESVPPFMRNKGVGWVTAEYGMLPGSSGNRITRESVRGKLSGRTQEIQRLIGRTLRTVTDRDQLGERSILIDCDVIQADGGTRCAAITGGFVALVLALRQLRERGVFEKLPIHDFVAAASVGMIGKQAVLDLNYREDSTADVDMNVIMTGRGKFIELQGTAEKTPFNNKQLASLLGFASRGIRQLIRLQQRALGASSLKKL